MKFKSNSIFFEMEVDQWYISLFGKAELTQEEKEKII